MSDLELKQQNTFKNCLLSSNNNIWLLNYNAFQSAYIYLSLSFIHTHTTVITWVLIILISDIRDILNRVFKYFSYSKHFMIKITPGISSPK